MYSRTHFSYNSGVASDTPWTKNDTSLEETRTQIFSGGKWVVFTLTAQ